MNPTADEEHLEQLLIDVAELRRQIADGSVRLLHAGGPAQFRDAHIPGSVTADPPAGAVAGTAAEHTVVVYGAAPADPLARALARHLSTTHRVRLLDGGLTTWVQAGGPAEGRGTDT